jgi:hypothetical protein
MSTVVSLLSGAAVGAVLAALISARFEREHEWRKSLSEAAAEYASKLAGASNAVRYALEQGEALPRENPQNKAEAKGELEKAIDDGNQLTNELVVPLARVELLFFRHPSTQEAAAEAFETLRAAADALRSASDPTQAHVLYEAAESQRKHFRNLVAHSLRKSFWLAA